MTAESFQSLFGLIVFILFAWLLSENRKQFPYRIVAVGVFLQLLLAVSLVYAPAAQKIIVGLNAFVEMLDQATAAGTSFVFGYLGGGKPPFSEEHPSYSFILAFKALPMLLVISALSAILFHWRVLPLVVNGFAYLLRKTMRIGGAEGVGLSANIFLGMVESPLVVRHYIDRMTRSEIFSLMVCGMATIAGTMMVLYATILGPVLPNALGHLMIASIISVPASLVIAKVMVPETSATALEKVTIKVETRSTMEALTSGTLQGVNVVINIIAMLIVLIALVHLVNLILGWIPPYAGQAITLQRLLGVLMAPLVWLMGIPWHEAHAAGLLMGIKTILNEFLAYLELVKTGSALSERSRTIMVYALCGFANIGSLGIMLGGLFSIAPQRKQEFLSLGFKCVVGGTLATCMTGAVIGIFFS